MKKALICLLLPLVVGCGGSSGTTYDLADLRGKIHMGASELEVTSQTGPPTEVKVDGDERRLIYKAKEGSASIEVTLKGNVVIDVANKD